MSDPTNLRTPTEIAKHLRVPVYRVRYAIRSRPIEPTLVAGDRAFFDPARVESIRLALLETAENGRPSDPSMVWAPTT